MTIALLDINDSNLRLWHEDKQLQSPGYALLSGKQYRFGNSARAEARVHPRQVNTRFWWQLNTQPLQPALGPARHTADLVHAHLLDIYTEGGKPEEVLLSVSSSLQRDQLALILGIIEQCPFHAVGLVNRSVALGSLYGGPGKLYHLEIQLHQAIISELTNTGGQVELQRTIPLPGCGLLQLQERLVEIIAAAFIRQTRFDPRRKAETEQLLYDALPAALRDLQSVSETNLEVNGYRARIVRSELTAAGSRLFNSAPEAIGTLTAQDRIILDPLADLLPGLSEHMGQSDILTNDALPQALNLHLDTLVQRDQTLNFITTLPGVSEHQTSAEKEAPESTAEQSPVSAPQATPPPMATHLLQGASARRLVKTGTPMGPGIELHYDQQQWLLRGEMTAQAQVNGTGYLQGTALFPGDSITFGNGAASVLIEVQP